MGLNIKSAEAHALAAELAKLTGESMTRAVTEALRERLERERARRDRKRRLADLRAIAREAASYPRKDDRSVEEFLYDERGLPR